MSFLPVMILIIRFWIFVRRLHAYPHVMSPEFKTDPTMLNYSVIITYKGWYFFINQKYRHILIYQVN